MRADDHYRLSGRAFATLAPAVWLLFHGACLAADARKVEANRVAQVVLASDKEYADPFNEVELDFIFTRPDAKELRVPAFWAGGGEWRVRYASDKMGVHRYRSQCSDRANGKLHAVSGQIEVVPYTGDNPLYRHGPLRVSADRRHFEHADGTPFLWLGDTWWMGLSRRLHWPDEFKQLAADRRKKGFNVIQIVAGLYPDMPAFDERGAGDDGFPWEKDYSRIRPEYFAAADRRIEHLADSGFVTCVVGAWGYHLPLLGVERMKKHWRYVAARWGALPVVWCVAGEGMMPFYLSTQKTEDAAFQKQGWTEVATYLRAIDPFHRLLSIHPTGENTSRNMFSDVSLLDFDMLQGGHGDRDSLPGALRLVRASRAAEPPLPTVMSEVCYEGILGKCHADVQRFLIWSELLSCEAGQTYGANGIWQLNRKEQAYGASPHGGNWGTTPWDEAMQLAGSTQCGLAKKLLEKYPWQKFEPRQEMVTVEADKLHSKMDMPFAAGLGHLLIVYVPTADRVVVSKLDPRRTYQATYFDPVTGNEKPLGKIEPDRNGVWLSPLALSDHDQVFILEADKQTDKPDGGKKPVCLHPDNPKYFLFRGKPLVLIAASEHYGSVVNRAFDFDRYLRDAADKAQTMTRTFLLFREQQSSRNPSSPVKPESPDYVAPWPRTGPATALDGEPIYDLDRWNAEYFERLHRFLDRASRLGIVVELTLFSNAYGDGVWALNPLRAENNKQKIGSISWADYTSLKDRSLVDRQLAYARKIVEETSGDDNIYYEICNEPGGGVAGHATPADVDAWQAEIARAVRRQLNELGRTQLVFGSQAFSYTPKFHQELDDSFAGSLADVVNVHPLPDTILGGRTYMLGNFMSKELALGELADFCRAAGRQAKPCVLDEDNAASLYRDLPGWTIHRKRAWTAVMSQAHYDFIDFSITVGSETGTRDSERKIRAWMKHLSQFMHGLDFIHARPLKGWIESKPEHVLDVALAVADREYVAYLADRRETGEAGAGQPIAGEVSFRLPDGKYVARLYSPVTGLSSPGIRVEAESEPVKFDLPPFAHDIVLRVTRLP